ncbi:hypothetical protein ABIB27_002699 [Arthrobacter sp. UYEF21]
MARCGPFSNWSQVLAIRSPVLVSDGARLYRNYFDVEGH